MCLNLLDTADIVREAICQQRLGRFRSLAQAVAALNFISKTSNALGVGAIIRETDKFPAELAGPLL